ncbi:hypothetical protein PT974_09859 [Cladobotryum mycophilum]|uniref:Uncharacterized protein n=1 Tax=Cladobotryum mycophilum TaxID=491253 RepID=A0ABR0SHD7_9HYPO
MIGKTILLALSAVTVAIAGTPVEGGGWKEASPGYSQQQCAGGSVSGSTFYIPKSPNGSTSGSGCSNGHLRAERRYNNDYSSGVHQFGGSFTINSMSGNRLSIKQTFNGNAGPYFIMGVEQGGRLYSVEGGATIASGVAKVGATVRVNTVHDPSAKRYTVYINGQKAFEDKNAPGGSFYDKIGAYTTNSGTGDLRITWNDVQFWTK